MLALLLACTGDTPLPTGGATPILQGEGFWDRPFPSDSRMVDGHPDLDGFPGADSVALFAKYFELAKTLDGWGTNSPIYVRFAEDPDESRFPSPAGSLEPDSPVFLLDVDPESPHRGEAVPLVSEYRETADAYSADRQLAVAPLPGFPLRARTEYALVLTPPYADVGQMPGDWADEAEYADLVSALALRGLPTSQVAAATVFTTQDPQEELRKVAYQIQSGNVGRPAWEPDLTVYEVGDAWTVYEGHVTVPIWQEGQRPYRDEGGGFVFDANGEPVVQGWERVKFGLTVPDGSPPENGWPIVLYSHGTGGDHLTFVDDEGSAMARRDVAMFGIAQPLHDDRKTDDTSEDFDTFNYSNPAAGRTSFRQGAADQIFLAERLAEVGNDFLDSGATIPIDHDQLSFFGHSQGAMVGAIGASFLGKRCRAVGLSEAGGGTAASALLKVDPVPVEPILAAALGVESGTLTTFHPVLGLVQMLSEVTDPLNSGPNWFAEKPAWEAHPVPIMLTEGLKDTYTPPVTIESLATAARLPVVGTMSAEPQGFDLRSLGAEDLPAENNVTGWDRTAVTAGLAQFPDQDHFAIYYDQDAKDMYLDFLESAAYGTPTLE